MSTPDPIARFTEPLRRCARWLLRRCVRWIVSRPTRLELVPVEVRVRRRGRRG